MPEKVLAQLGIIIQDPSQNPHVEFFGEASTIRETWRRWCALWQDYQKEGMRLTFHQVQPSLPIHKPTPDNRFRISNFRQHRGIKPSRFESRCNFGSEGCSVHLGFHKKRATAERQFLRIWEHYGRAPGAQIWLLDLKVPGKRPPQNQRPLLEKIPQPRQETDARIECEFA